MKGLKGVDADFDMVSVGSGVMDAGFFLSGLVSLVLWREWGNGSL